MKFRSDYVSNSSSCSFVISEPSKAFQQLQKDFSDVLDCVPYDFYELEVCISAKRKDMADIYGIFHESDWKEDSDYGYWAREQKAKDPEEVVDCWEFDLEQIFRFVRDWEAEPVQMVFDKIVSIRISTDDAYQGRVNYLRLLYLYFEKAGMKIDCHDSEIQLEADESAKNFMAALMRKVLSDGRDNSAN